MPEKISHCDLVIKFFESKESDLTPLIGGNRERLQSVVKAEVISEPLVLPQYEAIADYTAVQKGEMSLAAGSIVVIVDKKDTGWWFGQSTDDERQGWVPATYLDPVNEAASEDEAIYASLPINPERFVCIENYTSCRSDEISVSIGQVVEVVRQTPDGWWLVKFGKDEGYFPAAYIRKANTLKAKDLISKHDSKYSVKRPSPVSRSLSIDRDLSKYAPPRLRSKPKPPRPSTQPRIRKQNEETVHWYNVISNFEKTVDDGISLCAGQQVKLLMKDDSGWWLVESGVEQGWAPSTYLELTLPSPPSYQSTPSVPSKPTRPTVLVKSSPETKSHSNLIEQPSTKPNVHQKLAFTTKPTVKPKPVLGTRHVPNPSTSSDRNNSERVVNNSTLSVSELRQKLKSQFEKNS